MKGYRIDFTLLDWESPMLGVRQKMVVGQGKKLRLVEYTREMPAHWCKKGHIGCIIDGRLEIEFQDGIRIFEQGDGVFIPEGEEHRHKARALTVIVRAVFVEDI
jgi:quercetin dioxygenase-like cupin family protein